MKNIVGLVLEVLSITVPIFVVILIGFFLRRKKIIGDTAVSGLNRLAYNVGLPALIIISIIKYNLSEIFNFRIIVTIYSAYFAFLLVIMAVASFIKAPRKTRGALMVSSYRCNMAFIGFPIIISAYGNLALAKASLIVVFLTPINIITSVLIFKLFNRGEERIKVKKLIVDLLLDPLILSAAAGILISSIDINIPAPVNSVLDILSSMSIGIALLAIGASFRFFHIKSNIRALAFVSLAKLVIMPAIALFFAMVVFKLAPVDRNIIVVQFSMPLAVIAYVMAKQYHSDYDMVSSSLIITTILSSITISGWLLLLKLF
ncbi:MAG: AEC family transporter [Actinomycetota bacterium]|nr:AEC family transporter [Actinomycetota bacterium]